MYFSSLTDFITMGGHGLYVWSAYAVTLIVIVYNLAAPVLQRRRVRGQVLRQSRLDHARQQQNFQPNLMRESE